jgi:toxin ParE1/3/4
MKPVSVHPEAEAETDGAFEWYWARSESAALGFDAELRIALRALQKNPQIYATYLSGTRRIMLNRYPFSIVYRELPRKIQIVAVAHSKRRPDYWKRRI